MTGTKQACAEQTIEKPNIHHMIAKFIHHHLQASGIPGNNQTYLIFFIS